VRLLEVLVLFELDVLEDLDFLDWLLIVERNQRRVILGAIYTTGNWDIV
jgi:hypothetical protein